MISVNHNDVPTVKPVIYNKNIMIYIITLGDFV